MSPSMEKERVDHQVLNSVLSGTESDRDTLAEYQIRLAAFFCISVPERLERCVGKYPEKLWVKIPNYFCLSAYQTPCRPGTRPYQPRALCQRGHLPAGTGADLCPRLAVCRP